jgi:hypothetical protein
MFRLGQGLKVANPWQGLTLVVTRGFAGLGSKRKPTKKDLDKYDVISVGSNLGGMFTKHFDKAEHGKWKIMCVLD